MPLHLAARRGWRQPLAHGPDPCSNGRPWSFRSILTILRNRVYIGEVFFRGKWHPAPHPPLVDRPTFHAVQNLLTERGADHARRAAVNSEYLRGLVICQSCGHHMLGTAAVGRTNRYRYYTSYGRHQYGKSACATDLIDTGRLDQAVLEAPLATFQNEALLDRAVALAAD